MSPLALETLLPPDVPPERVAACIGLLSDTHMPERCAALPATLGQVLAGVDLLLHAGDVGELWVLDRLSRLAPVVAVHGNDETEEAQRELPYQQLVTVAGRRILLTHAHYPDRAEELASRQGDAWEPKLERRAEMARRAGAGIAVFGHLHVPLVCRHGDVLLVSPGAIASGNSVTRQSVQTVALLFLRDDGTPFVAHVDLAAPGKRFDPGIDWGAGYAAAAARFSESILSPELDAVWGHWKELQRLAPGPSRSALLRAARRCWAGEQATITIEALLAELEADAAFPAELRAQFAAVLSPRGAETSPRAGKDTR